MISPINSFDVNGMQAAYGMGKEIGAVNSPFTPLGNALKDTLDKYQAHIQMQNQATLMMARQDALQKAMRNRQLEVAAGERAMLTPKDAKGNPAPISPESFDPSNKDNNQRQVGSVTLIRRPLVYHGVITGSQWVDPRAATPLEAFGLTGDNQQPTVSPDDQYTAQMAASLAQF